MPRFNNPSGVFDNDQYVYKIYAECGAAVNADIIDLMEDIQAWAGNNGNKIAFDQNSY